MAWLDERLAAVREFGQFKNSRAIGWFDPSKRLPTAKLASAFVEKLCLLVEAQPGFRHHHCKKCKEHFAEDVVLIVPGAGETFVASPWLRHLITRHQYVPPEVFVRAVMECPLPGSAEYEERVSALRLKPAEPPQQLVVLEGLEPVRLRPGMYIGSTDARGLTALLFEVVANALDLNLAGRASRIEISIAPDDTVTVEDDGDGFPLEATVGGTPAFTAIFERFHDAPTLDGHPTHVHVRPGLAGCGISVVQVLSERFEVETVRDGLLHHAVFEKGKLTSPLTCAGATTRRGTRIRYRADQTIIEAHHDLAAIETLLRPLGALLPKLDLRWQGQSLRRPGGLADWVKERAPRAIAESLLSVEGELHDVGVEVSFAWEPTRTTPWLLTFVNCAETTEAGTHAVGLFEAFSRTAPTPALAKQARAGLVAVVHVWMLHPRFRGPTRAALEVETARFAVRDVVSDALRKAPWWWDRLSEQLGR